MRIDRVFAEGEAVHALQRLGYTCAQPPHRPDQYLVSHSGIGGERTFTVEQLCRFAEGATIQAAYQEERGMAGARAAG